MIASFNVKDTSKTRREKNKSEKEEEFSECYFSSLQNTIILRRFYVKTKYLAMLNVGKNILKNIFRHNVIEPNPGHLDILDNSHFSLYLLNPSS